MRRIAKFNLTKTSRKEIRHELITEFLKEEPGEGTGDLCSHYLYEVDILSNGNKILLKRPARLNKGFDFEVHVENTNFGTLRRRTMPTHSDIYNDLKLKSEENAQEFQKVAAIIARLYNCEKIPENELRSLQFTQGHNIEAMLKAIKWLFIEQDMTYWNWSGRNMLYSYLSELLD